MMILLLALIGCATCSSLSMADFTLSTSSSDYYVTGNPVGIAFDFPELLPFLNNTLFKGYIMNSNLYGNWYSNFDQSVHMPAGYKYNCSKLSSIINSTVNCTYDLNNHSLLTELGDYIYDVTMYYAFNIGWDQQDASFSASYITDGFLPFLRALLPLAKQPINIELADKGNLYDSLNIRSNYTGDQFVQDCIAVNNAIYGLVITGPGTTDTADSSWYTINGKVYNYCGFFTLRAVAFPDVSTLTISNLLSENYTSQFLKRRMTANGTSYINDFSNYLGAISDLRMVDDPMGVPGLTDSFAACIWAMQITMEFFFLSGFRIDFYTSFKNGSTQTLFGSAPPFAPSSLYTTLLFLDIVLTNEPFIDLAPVVSGTSSSIRVYGLDYYYYYGVLIINKDMNTSNSGDVSIKIKDSSGLYCIYLTAQSLTSTSGVTIGGIRFVSNQSDFIGTYQQYSYVMKEGYYHIPLNHSQAVYCYTKAGMSYNYFPTDTSQTNWESRLEILIGVMMILTIALL